MNNLKALIVVLIGLLLVACSDDSSSKTEIDERAFQRWIYFENKNDDGEVFRTRAKNTESLTDRVSKSQLIANCEDDSFNVMLVMPNLSLGANVDLTMSPPLVTFDRESLPVYVTRLTENAVVFNRSDEMLIRLLNANALEVRINDRFDRRHTVSFNIGRDRENLLNVANDCNIDSDVSHLLSLDDVDLERAILLHIQIPFATIAQKEYFNTIGIYDGEVNTEFDQAYIDARIRFIEMIDARCEGVSISLLCSDGEGSKVSFNMPQSFNMKTRLAFSILEDNPNLSHVEAWNKASNKFNELVESRLEEISFSREILDYSAFMNTYIITIVTADTEVLDRVANILKSNLDHYYYDDDSSRVDRRVYMYGSFISSRSDEALLLREKIDSLFEENQELNDLMANSNTRFVKVVQTFPFSSAFEKIFPETD